MSRLGIGFALALSLAVVPGGAALRDGGDGPRRRPDRLAVRHARAASWDLHFEWGARQHQ